MVSYNVYSHVRVRCEQDCGRESGTQEGAKSALLQLLLLLLLSLLLLCILLLLLVVVVVSSSLFSSLLLLLLSLLSFGRARARAWVLDRMIVMILTTQ